VKARLRLVGGAVATREPHKVAGMRNIIGLTGAALFGSIAGWLGGQIHFAVAILLSAVASGVGLYYGYRWFDQNLD